MRAAGLGLHGVARIEFGVATGYDRLARGGANHADVAFKEMKRAPEGGFKLVSMFLSGLPYFQT